MVGRIIEASKYFNHPDYLDISNGLVFSETAYPKLFNVIKDEKWANAVLEQEINNPTPVISDSFGTSVSIYGNTAIMGAHKDDTGGTDVGSVYVYTRSLSGTWSLQQTINNPAPVNGDFFGYSTAIYKDTIIIGAYKKDDGLGVYGGAAFVYTRLPGGTTWTLEQEIWNPTPVNNDFFGHSVSIYEDTIVIGSSNEPVGANTQAGAMYIYTRVGGVWSLEQGIPNPSPTNGDYWAENVKIYKDTIVASSYLDDTGANAAGSAHVYTRTGTTWTLEQEITNPTPVATDYFGRDISIYEDTIVIGASNEDTGASGAGSAYVYTRSGGVWTLQQELNNPNPSLDAFFGYAVDIYGDTVIVGSYQDDTGASQAGSVFVYKRVGTSWGLIKEINNPSPVSSDYFGGDVSIYNDYILIGAIGEDTGASFAGSAYIYTKSTANDNVIQPRDTGNPDTKFFVKAK